MIHSLVFKGTLAMGQSSQYSAVSEDVILVIDLDQLLSGKNNVHSLNTMFILVKSLMKF